MEANAAGAPGSTAPRCVLPEEIKDIYKGCERVTPVRMEAVKVSNQLFTKFMCKSPFNNFSILGH